MLAALGSATSSSMMLLVLVLLLDRISEGGVMRP